MTSLASGWAIYVHLAIAVIPFDDAYISLRYAENLAAGHGLVYNEGERVFGASTPVFVLWLAALRLVVPGDLATAAVRANAIGFVLAALLAGRLVQRLTAPAWLGALVAAALLVNPALLEISSGAMESFWFIALATGRTQAKDEDRHFGLVVDDRAPLREALEAIGAEILPGRGLDFLDPWGNHIQVVEYRDIQFTKAPEVLDAMELRRLGKTDAALRELAAKGIRPARP